ncbi:MAG: ECF transporter S component [Caldilineales bacterium]|nr:ECF transporter S component [Caldilineales bacterium]
MTTELTSHSRPIARSEAPVIAATGRRVTLSSNLLPAAILILASLIGVVAFLSPFFTQVQQHGSQGLAHREDALLVLSVLTLLALAAIIANVQVGGMSAKTLAVLGALAAVGAVLRFVPGPAGFSAVFFLPILAGYAFGPQFGFLSGLVTLLASALLTGGVGPWLPYQMFAAGWVGALAGLIPHPPANSRRELALLVGAGMLLGMLYGVVMNLWFWPFVFQPAQAAMYWQPGTGLLETMRNYALFYVTTSFIWDLWRGIGNAALILLFGAPVLRLLRRYEQRFQFARTPASQGDDS